MRRAIVALVMLSGCDQVGRAEVEALRAELTIQAEALATQQTRIAALEAKLAEAHEPHAGTVREWPRSGVKAEAAEAVTTEVPTPMPVVTPKCVANHCVVQRAEVEALLASPAALTRLARVVPAVEDGATIGIKVFAIRAESPLALIGLKNGDLVRSLGGVELDGIDAVMRAYTVLLGLDRWVISGSRKGERFEITIELG